MVSSTMRGWSRYVGLEGYKDDTVEEKESHETPYVTHHVAPRRS